MLAGAVPWSLIAWCLCARNRVGPGRREAPRFGPIAPCPRGRLHTPPASACHRPTGGFTVDKLALRRPPHLLRHRRPQEHPDRLPAHNGCLWQSGSRGPDVPHRHRTTPGTGRLARGSGLSASCPGEYRRLLEAGVQRPGTGRTGGRALQRPARQERAWSQDRRPQIIVAEVGLDMTRFKTAAAPGELGGTVSG